MPENASFAEIYVSHDIGTVTVLLTREQASWNAGYAAGFAGKAPATPHGVDGLSFQSGAVEGKAARVLTSPKVLDLSTDGQA